MLTISATRPWAICRFVRTFLLSASVIGVSYYKVANNDECRIFDLHQDIGAVLTGIGLSSQR
ncbi:hypothetical protein BDR06DRAFT_962676 [Suillus hirtellus]|nr:hypothetical protein BDR06DRAFT_962676 [Suillus hirtellus]